MLQQLLEVLERKHSIPILLPLRDSTILVLLYTSVVLLFDRHSIKQLVAVQRMGVLRNQSFQWDFSISAKEEWYNCLITRVSLFELGWTLPEFQAEGQLKTYLHST